MWYLTACKIPISLWFFELDQKWNDFYRISELMLPTLIQRYDKKIILFQERETNWNFTGFQMPHIMIVSIPQFITIY